MKPTKITTKEVKEAIRILESNSLRRTNPFYAWVSIGAAFYMKFPKLCDEAQKLNGKKSIFDKRTRGWKLIKEKYLKFYP